MSNIYEIYEINRYLHNKTNVIFSSLNLDKIYYRQSYKFRINGYIDFEDMIKINITKINSKKICMDMSQEYGKLLSSFHNLNENVKKALGISTTIKITKNIGCIINLHINDKFIQQTGLRPKIVYFVDDAYSEFDSDESEESDEECYEESDEESWNCRELNKKRPVDNLPDSVKKIVFDCYFNDCVDNLPKSVKKIEFGYYFNQTVNKLPNSVKYIKFGCKFNQKIDKLPKQLKSLKLGDNFNKKIDKLPEQLKSLKLGRQKEMQIEMLPKSLVNLELRYGFEYRIYNLPKLRLLNIGGTVIYCDDLIRSANIIQILTPYSHRNFTFMDLSDDVNIVILYGIIINDTEIKIPKNLKRVYVSITDMISKPNVIETLQKIIETRTY